MLCHTLCAVLEVDVVMSDLETGDLDTQHVAQPFALFCTLPKGRHTLVCDTSPDLHHRRLLKTYVNIPSFVQILEGLARWRALFCEVFPTLFFLLLSRLMYSP